MNWFDFMLLAAFVIGALYGLRIGLIKAVFVTVGVYIGWLAAGQWSDDIGGLFDGSVSNDTIVTVLSYAVIIAAAMVASTYIVKIVKPLLTVFTLGVAGLVDRLGGLVLGVVMGIALMGALIVGSARLTYNLDIKLIDDVIPETLSGRLIQLEDQVARVEDGRESLETAMTESEFVSAFLDVADSLPGDTLGLIPSDFKISLDILRGSIE